MAKSTNAREPTATMLGPTNLVVLQSTSFCNIDCNYCYLPDRSLHRRMPLEVLEATLFRLNEAEILDSKVSFLWHAGEPLTRRPQFYERAFEIIRRETSHLRQVNLNIQTNATLIDAEWCDLFKRYDVNIGVSIDGPEAINDDSRVDRAGRGTFQKAMRGMQALEEFDIPYSTISVLTASSIDHVAKIESFLSSTKSRSWGFNIEEIEGVNETSSFGPINSEIRIRRFYRELFKLASRSGNIGKIREFRKAQRSILSYASKTRAAYKPLERSEATPFKIFNVASNGDFSTYSPELLSFDVPGIGSFSLGNVFQDKIRESAQTDKFLSIRRAIESGVNRCKDTCVYFGVCGGGSPSNKYWENGEFDSTETLFCRGNVMALTDAALAQLELDDDCYTT